jgi:hypothetical protein
MTVNWCLDMDPTGQKKTAIMGGPLPAKLAALRKGKIMRFGFLVALFMCLAGADLARSSTAGDVYFAQNVKPQIEAYNACAVQHLINLARIEPNRPFDEIEITLKPACGIHIDLIKEALARIGFTLSQSNNFISNIYKGGVAVYMSAYEREAIAELGRRRAAQAAEAERQQAARTAELQRQQAARSAETERQRASEADAERKKVFQAAENEHMACLRKQMVEIVPYSNESACGSDQHQVR